MRDAQSALDQVIAFAGTTITTDDVSTVLGIVGRDLLFDIVTGVADENPMAAFTLAGRAVELGYDLRLVCRELASLARGLLLVNVDPSCAADPEVATESERERLVALAARFSREDLLRGFDLLSRADREIKETRAAALLPRDAAAAMDPPPQAAADRGRDRGARSRLARRARPAAAVGRRRRWRPASEPRRPRRPTFGRPDPLRKPGRTAGVALADPGHAGGGGAVAGARRSACSGSRGAGGPAPRGAARSRRPTSATASSRSSSA